MSTLFTKIIQGEIPSYKVYEDENYFAFLSIAPLADGHTLIVPKKESEDWLAMDQSEIGDYFRAAHLLAGKLKVVFGTQKVAVLLAGFEVPHTHIHLIPCNDESALTLSQASPASKEYLALIHARIEAAL